MSSDYGKPLEVMNDEIVGVECRLGASTRLRVTQDRTGGDSTLSLWIDDGHYVSDREGWRALINALTEALAYAHALSEMPDEADD